MSWLPPDLSAAVTLALVATSYCTSFITAAFGIGGGGPDRLAGEPFTAPLQQV